MTKRIHGKGNGNPADVLLTLLDNLGFTDNYMECMVPTVGVYPIATANDKDQYQCTADVPFCSDRDSGLYTGREKDDFLTVFSLPKVLKRMGMSEQECIVTPEGLDVVVRKYENTTGIRDLEQAAEHIAANALYQIEVNHVASVTFDAAAVEALLE